MTPSDAILDQCAYSRNRGIIQRRITRRIHVLQEFASAQSIDPILAAKACLILVPTKMVSAPSTKDVQDNGREIRPSRICPHSRGQPQGRLTSDL